MRKSFRAVSDGVSGLFTSCSEAADPATNDDNDDDEDEDDDEDDGDALDKKQLISWPRTQDPREGHYHFRLLRGTVEDGSVGSFSTFTFDFTSFELCFSCFSLTLLSFLGNIHLYFTSLFHSSGSRVELCCPRWVASCVLKLKPFPVSSIAQACDAKCGTAFKDSKTVEWMDIKHWANGWV